MTSALRIVKSTLNSRSFSSTERGYDVGKKVAGRKRHILVDVLGLLLVVVAIGSLRFSIRERQLSFTLATKTGKDPWLAGYLLPAHLFGEMPEHLAVALTTQTRFLRCQTSTELTRSPQEDPLLVIAQGCHCAHLLTSWWPLHACMMVSCRTGSVRRGQLPHATAHLPSQK